MPVTRRFNNNPTLRDDSGEPKIKRFVHSPLTVEHNGVNASITKDGKVIFSKVAKVLENNEVEYDEIEISASLIYKMANLLRDTRKVKYISLAELSQIKTEAVEEV